MTSGSNRFILMYLNWLSVLLEFFDINIKVNKMKNIIISCLMLLVGCSGTVNNSKIQSITASDKSVVTIVRPVFKYDEDGVETTGIGWQDHCSAFAVSTKSGTMLITAAHCLPNNGGINTEIAYIPPNGWGHDKAVVTWINNVDDLAVLSPENPKSLVPIKITDAPTKGEYIYSTSSIFGKTNGKMIYDVGPTRIETDLNVEHGWSGSPALTKNGVFGVLILCRANLAISHDCLPGHASVSVLPNNL